MLYELLEWQHSSLMPLRLWATANMAVYGNPFNPLSYHRLGRLIFAGSDLLLRVTHRYPKPHFGLNETTVNGRVVKVTEEAIVQKPFCTLLHFRRHAVVEQPSVLVVAPLSGHYATLLRDTVRMLIQDHDVYITDWHDARTVPISQGPFHFHDYVKYVMEFFRMLGPKTHVISVCQPTAPVLAGMSLLGASGGPLPATMIMMGGPIDTRKSPTSVNEFARGNDLDWFERNVVCRVPANYPGYLRKVVPGFFQLAGFVSMNVGRHFESHLDYFYHLVEGDGESAETHRRFYDEYNAVMDLPAEYYLDTVKMVFQEHQLPRGTMVLGGRKVDPSAIVDTALFTIEGELDDISGSGQTMAAHELCSNIPPSRRRHLTVEGAGHYGIFSGRRYRTSIYPEIRDFIASHARK